MEAGFFNESAAATPLGAAGENSPRGGSCSTVRRGRRRSLGGCFSSALGWAGAGARVGVETGSGSGSFGFGSTGAIEAGVGETGAAGAGGSCPEGAGGGDDFWGASSVGPERILANDMGSAALAGFFLVISIWSREEFFFLAPVVIHTAASFGDGGGGSREMENAGGPLPVLEKAGSASFLGGDWVAEAGSGRDG